VHLYQLQKYNFVSVASESIKEGECQFVLPNALPEDTSPRDWEDAEEIDLN